MGTYFATYIVGDISVLSGVSGIAMLGVLPSLVLAPLLSNKISKHYLYGGGIALSGAGILLRLIDVHNIGLWMVGTALSGIGSGLLATIMYSIQADNCDYVAYKNGIRAEGAVASLNSFIIKAAQGIGSALPAYILGWTGFVANQVQSSQATNGIIFSAITLPGILTVVAGLLMLLFYPLNNKKLADIRQKLQQRNLEQ